MSVNPDMSATSYADHDVHHIAHKVQWSASADSGPSDFLESIEQFEITERGLDPDELAELRAARVQVSTALETTTNQGLPGNVEAFVGAGYNLSGDEFVQKAKDETTVDADNSGTDDFIIATKDTDEVGQIYSSKVVGSAAFGDGSNGVGGGGNHISQAELLPMADLFGAGPFVDAADDFSSRIAIQVNDMLDSVSCNVVYSLYYDVSQTEGGRSRFGR